MKVSHNFELQEFVDPIIYRMRGDKSIELLDPKIIQIAEFIRGHFGAPVIINNWHNNGQYSESGLRRFDCCTGAKYSQHKYGRAIDVKIKGVTDYEEIRNEIRKNFALFRLVGLTTIERGTPTWLHCDCRLVENDLLNEVPFK